jgi:hypothetical protein
MRQAYEGMLRAVETQSEPLPAVLLGKTAAARLAEECLRRLTRIMGEAPSRAIRRSDSGSKMSARSATCAHPGDSPTTRS